MSEIWQLPATELAQRIARRQLSSAEVIDAHLARIDAVNPALNAVVRVLADEARAAAALADKKLADGETIGPLHGVPFTVKENIDMGRRGIHDEGSRTLQERLKGKVRVDFETARRLFTLICVLHWKG